MNDMKLSFPNTQLQHRKERKRQTRKVRKINLQLFSNILIYTGSLNAWQKEDDSGLTKSFPFVFTKFQSNISVSNFSTLTLQSWFILKKWSTAWWMRMWLCMVIALALPYSDFLHGANLNWKQLTKLGLLISGFQQLKFVTILGIFLFHFWNYRSVNYIFLSNRCLCALMFFHFFVRFLCNMSKWT